MAELTVFLPSMRQEPKDSLINALPGLGCLMQTVLEL